MRPARSAATSLIRDPRLRLQKPLLAALAGPTVLEHVLRARRWLAPASGSDGRA